VALFVYLIEPKSRNQPTSIDNDSAAGGFPRRRLYYLPLESILIGTQNPRISSRTCGRLMTVLRGKAVKISMIRSPLCR